MLLFVEGLCLMDKAAEQACPHCGGSFILE